VAATRRADPYRDLDVIDARAPRVNQFVVGSLCLATVVTDWWGLVAAMALQLLIGLLFWAEVLPSVRLLLRSASAQAGGRTPRGLEATAFREHLGCCLPNYFGSRVPDGNPVAREGAGGSGGRCGAARGRDGPLHWM